METIKLSSAQVEALHRFSQAGGHGFGEYSGISRPTARVLERLGLITVSSVRLTSGTYNRMWLGQATDAGRKALTIDANGAVVQKGQP